MQNSLNRAFTHASIQASVSTIKGGDAKSAFLSGFLGSAIGSGTNGLDDGVRFGISALSGAGISTAVNGCNFWENLAISSIIVGANHLMDKGGDEEPKKLAPNPTVERNTTVPEQGFRGIQTDYTIESLVIPVGQGLKILGRGLGVLGSQSKLIIMGGASKGINYYTQKAVKAGFSSALKGESVKAGIFVQVNQNFSRLFRSNFNGKWKTLYSNSPASIQGRYWQNQAIGIGASSTGVGEYATYNGLNNK